MKDDSQKFSDTINLKEGRFSLVKVQRDGVTAIYKNADSYLRIGDPEKIGSDLAFHREMVGFEFPVATILAQGETDSRRYYIESSLGEKHFGDIFAEDTEKFGAITETSFNAFLAVTGRFAQAQLRTRSTSRDLSGFAQGIHLDILCQELPEYQSQIMAKFEEAQSEVSEFSFVLTHGDFNPHNIYPTGVIDFEDSFRAPFGQDLIGALVHIEYVPDFQGFEYFARYHFSEEQKNQYYALLDRICAKESLPNLSEFREEFEFTRAVWLLVRMHQFPKLQKFRYDKFIKKFLRL